MPKGYESIPLPIDDSGLIPEKMLEVRARAAYYCSISGEGGYPGLPPQ